jgi:Leucine-rich repeat (LRR) protein
MQLNLFLLLQPLMYFVFFFFRLDFLPDSLFKLPSLTVLDVSNNKLQKIPIDIWNAPKLKEMNASFNLLVDLPNFLTESPFDITGSSELGKKLDLLTPRRTSHGSEKSSISFSDEDSLEDAKMMRSMQLATINLTPQELTHHRYCIILNYIFLTN